MNKLYKPTDYLSRDMLNFYLSQKGLGIAFPSYFVYGFLRNISSCYILLIDKISLPGYLYFLRYWTMCVL